MSRARASRAARARLPAPATRHCRPRRTGAAGGSRDFRSASRHRCVPPRCHPAWRPARRRRARWRRRRPRRHLRPVGHGVSSSPRRSRVAVIHADARTQVRLAGCVDWRRRLPSAFIFRVRRAAARPAARRRPNYSAGTVGLSSSSVFLRRRRVTWYASRPRRRRTAP